MAKKESYKQEDKKYKDDKKKEPQATTPQPTSLPAIPNLPPDVAAKLEEIKTKIDKFTKDVLEKFDKYIVGIGLLPPPRQDQLPPGAKPLTPEELKKVHVLVLVDDSDRQKMTRQELLDKMTSILDASAKAVDPDLIPQPVLLSEMWQSCYDGKYDLLQMVSLAAPTFDRGMLGAVKIAELHKTMVLQKFEKYIVAYVLAGSIVRGQATAQSDIDVWIVIDDTDVKKMTRAELKDKLRGIIIGMGFEAGEKTGIRNKINIQVYILTEFWDALRESNPVMFTLLRDGVPFFDRGIFMPWKQLLKMGKIKPSQEAIDMHLSAGEQTLDRVKWKMKEVAIEDFFWAISGPSQAALMMYGIPPPAPRELVDVIREIFVKKEKLLTEADVSALDKVIQVRKDLEHGVKKEVTGKELDELLKLSEKYFARLKRLFTQIEHAKEEETLRSLYDSTTTAIRDILRTEGIESVDDAALTEMFEKKLIATGKVHAKYVRVLHDLMDAKQELEGGKATKSDIDKVRREASEFLRSLVEHLQRKRVQDLERVKVRVRWGDNKVGEVTLLGNTAFIIKRMDAEPRELLKSAVKQDGSLGSPENASLEEFEQALSRIAVPQKVFLREKTLESLKLVFGKELELMIGG